jgi:hypothetical protein
VVQGIVCTLCEVHSQNMEHAPFKCESGLHRTVGFAEVTGEALKMLLPSRYAPSGRLTQRLSWHGPVSQRHCVGGDAWAGTSWTVASSSATWLSPQPSLWPLLRQVRLTAGTVAVARTLASVGVSWTKWLAGAVGAGLVYVAVTHSCPFPPWWQPWDEVIRGRRTARAATRR